MLGQLREVGVPKSLLKCSKISGYCSGTISFRGYSLWTCAAIASLMSFIEAAKTVYFSVFTIWKQEDQLIITIFPRNGSCGQVGCSNTPSCREWISSGGFSVTPWTETGASWQCVIQVCDPNIMLLEANRTAPSYSHNQGIRKRYDDILTLLQPFVTAPYDLEISFRLWHSLYYPLSQ